MNDIRVILAARPGEPTEIYLDAIKKFGILIDIVHSIKALHDSLLETAHNGILIDLPILIKSPITEKKFLSTIIDQFPIMQLNYDAVKNEIHSLYYGKTKGDVSLDAFVRTECRSFPARKMRSALRKNVHLNVTVWYKTSPPPYDTEKTVTLDISKGGCFIITSTARQIDSDIEFVIQELSEQSPISGRIRRIIPWGEGMQLPGIGVEFIHIKENQLNELCDKFKLCQG
ncbi:MAG: PilZ domain-containing protein [Desulfobacterales bacterium]|nr:PilZ domain-containing protein [Desulfobacterales bacterium]MDD4072108.1 PilZ domain-containing protein [Desulfobacterales bacterium]MDD4392744.1 PilZ domain-containing protein [Desulfobacterales bacterium]